jgi:hypothetical protein
MTSNSSMTPEDEEYLKKIFELLSINSIKRGIATSPNTVILDSSNLSQTLEFTQYYDLIIWVNGTPSSDITVNINSSVTNSIAGVSYLKLNASQTRYIIRGIRLNSISVNSTTISTYSVYVTYMGYSDYREPELSV